MNPLAQEHCVPVAKGSAPLDADAIAALRAGISPDWDLGGTPAALARDFRFRNFHETMAFVNAVAWIAHAADHHPDLAVGYNRCRVTWSTHAAGGLTRNDFICAARVDALGVPARA